MISVSLPHDTWQFVINALAELPAKHSMMVIFEINRQVAEQLPPPAAPIAPAPAPEAVVDEARETFGKAKP